MGIDANLELKKRGVFSLASRIYDPMGILSPVTIQFKVLRLRRLSEKVEILGTWINPVLSTLHPEILFHHVEDKTGAVYSLQGFSDASQEAYAAVIYLKVATSYGVQVRFVASKTRVAPAKGMTIPRLAALLLSKLMVSVNCALESELTLDDPSCFTDSKVTLYWIQGMETVHPE